MSHEAVKAVQAAVSADPNNVPLRLALADLLVASGRPTEAVTEAAKVLARDPGNAQALALVTGGVGDGPTASAPAPEAAPAETVSSETVSPEAAAPQEPAADTPPDFDWHHAEQQLDAAVPPPFVDPGQAETGHIRPGGPPQTAGVAPLEPGLPRISFADVGGLDDVKQRLNESFIQPMRHAEIAKAFGKSLRGGLLLYGAPGCGKTYMARAVAGELGAGFMSLVMTDVVDSYRGQTEKNIHSVFQEARHNDGPTVLFLDEIDALALKRSGLTGPASWLRGSVNQLLLEMDSMQGNNDGLYVLAATNHPWDLDEAVLRPGRLDRAVLVSPPDATARAAILRTHLAARPVAGIDLAALTQATGGFSGADLEHLTVTAAEKAMTESIAAGSVQPLTMHHLQLALAEVRPSTGEWMQSARNVVRFANDSGRYDDLRRYLSTREASGKSGQRKGWWS